VKHTLTTLAEVGLLLTACCTVSSQDEGDNGPRTDVNLGMPLSGPVTPIGQSTNFGWGVTVGGGHTFTWKQAIGREFVWSHLFVPGSTLAPVRAALQNSNSNASGELYMLTGYYRFELRGETLGTYLAAGGELYHPPASLSQRVTKGTNITWEPTREWWGFSCSSETVTSNQTLRSSTPTALGLNGGFGFTVSVGGAPYRVYVESRYHYAPTRGINPQLVTVTLGIRY
jgi:hypothetical protein